MREIRYPDNPHRSGQARIRLGGKDVYLGKFGTRASHEKFHRVVAEFYRTGEPPGSNGEPPASHTLGDLINSFRLWAEKRYVKNGRQTSEVGLYKLSCGSLLDVAPIDMPANDILPTHLTTMRTRLAELGLARGTINGRLRRIKTMYAWGVEQGFVDPSAWHGLKAVRGAKKGEAKTPPKITPAPTQDILAIRNEVPPSIWALVQLCILTGCRPGEAVVLRPCDIDRVPPVLGQGVWVWKPYTHKTEHHEKERVIVIGPQCQQHITPFVDGLAPDAFVFTAERSLAEIGRKVGKMATLDHLSESTFMQAIHRACKRAEVSRWSPSQLRKNFATDIRGRHGIEDASVLLGHSSVSTTEIYAEVNFRRVAEIMAKVG